MEEEKTTIQEPQTEKTDKKEEKNIIAILSYIGILVLVPLLMEKKDEFVKFHAKQGLVLFIAEVITSFFTAIPLIGWFLGPVIWIFWIILSVVGIINVLNGKRSPLPLIGGFANQFKF